LRYSLKSEKLLDSNIVILLAFRILNKFFKIRNHELELNFILNKKII